MSLRASPQRLPRSEAALPWAAKHKISIFAAGTALLTGALLFGFWLLLPVQNPGLEKKSGSQRQSWTDGGAGMPTIPMCTWQHSSVMDSSEGSSDTCAALIGIPKVAMLFLTKGPMPHEVLWALWLKQAAGLLPVDCVAASTCGSNDRARLQAMQQACGIRAGETLQQQHLFSLYIHPPPTHPAYPEESIFHGREIEQRINASWGTFDLAQVTRNLMTAALQDPLNQRFITISESCIPLYPPAVVYQQLMYTGKSRINGCRTNDQWDRSEWRWTFRFTEATGGKLQKGMWRKNHQWLGLTRKHARLSVDDVEIATVFAKHCYSGKDPDFGGWWRTCFSDEHYHSTLLAFHGLDNETDCSGDLTHTVWCPHCQGEARLHPKAYTAAETTMHQLRQLRQVDGGCDVGHALASAGNMMTSMSQLTDTCGRLPANAVNLMAPKCPLLARKFTADSLPPAALQAVFQLLLSDEAVQMDWKQKGRPVCRHPAQSGSRSMSAGAKPSADPNGRTLGDSLARLVNEATLGQNEADNDVQSRLGVERRRHLRGGL